MTMVEKIGDYEGSVRKTLQLKSLFKKYPEDEKTNSAENMHDTHKSSERDSN